MAEIRAHRRFPAGRRGGGELVESEVLSPPNLAERRYLAAQAARLGSSLTSST